MMGLLLTHDPFHGKMESFQRGLAMTVAESNITSRISAEERQKRQDNLNFARGNVRLEGFILDDETEALYARYVNGELNRPELNAAILRLSGLNG